MTIEILNHKKIQGMMSASGIVKSEGRFYVIGDDSPYLYSLNSDFETISKKAIYSTTNFLKNRIAKSKKPDFEALEMINNEEVIAFGSGSKSPERDVFKRISFNNFEEVQSYTIADFYDSLRNLDILKTSHLNIEAVAYRNNHLYLFNRGRNLIISFIYNDFLSYLEGHAALPKLEVNSYSLPKINGLEAGFSGATTLKNHPYIIFTASVEDTPNAYDDGEIMGSFIGMIKIENDAPSRFLKSAILPITKEKLKVESVTIKEEVKLGETLIVLVTDDDLTESHIMECRMLW